MYEGPPSLLCVVTHTPLSFFGTAAVLQSPERRHLSRAPLSCLTLIPADVEKAKKMPHSAVFWTAAGPEASRQGALTASSATRRKGSSVVISAILKTGTDCFQHVTLLC